ncbi:MAG TPA: DUF4252 domain-containing protein [Pyrinomonadaceae bacterium]|nr:DUF4252 domain-containing protein [Pyrinomonadaceae bacterium]
MMKLIYSTSIRFLLSIVFVAVATGVVAAQDPKLQTVALDHLSSKANQTLDVNIDEHLIQLTAKFLSTKEPDEAKIKEIVNGLKGIYVKSFQFENEGEYSAADVEAIRSQLRGPAWSRVVNFFSKKEGSVEVYLMTVGTHVSGLAVLASDPKELTIVNIVGPVDLEKLTQLEGQFGIPDLEIEPAAKPVRKN